MDRQRQSTDVVAIEVDADVHQVYEMVVGHHPAPVPAVPVSA